MWELDYKESWALKNWCFQTVMLGKTLESFLESKEIKIVNLKGNQPSIFIGRTDAEGEAPILWPPDVNCWLLGKDPDAMKNWRQRRGRQRMRWLDGITYLMDMSLISSKSWWRTGRPRVLQCMGLQRVGHDWVTEFTYRKKTIKNTNIWRLNNTLLNNQQIMEEIKICIETKENENMTTQNLWDSLKSNAKRKVYSITSLPQETREKSNK